MPVSVAKRKGKYRILEPGGKIAKSKNGNPADGGGHSTKDKADRQAKAINRGGKYE